MTSFVAEGLKQPGQARGVKKDKKGLPKAAEGSLAEMDATPPVLYRAGTHTGVSFGSQIWDASCKATEHLQSLKPVWALNVKYIRRF